MMDILFFSVTADYQNTQAKLEIFSATPVILINKNQQLVTSKSK